MASNVPTAPCQPTELETQVQRFLALPRMLRSVLVIEEEELCRPAVVQALLTEAEVRAAEVDPESANLARQALALAERLVPTIRLPAPVILDFQASAWILIATEAVSRESPDEAGMGFAIASKLAEVGSGDPLVEGALAYGLALYHWVQEEEETCLRYLDQAQAVFTQVEQTPEVGAVLIRRGFVLAELGCPREAAEALREGIQKTEGSRFHLLSSAAGKVLARLETEESPNLPVQ